MGQLILRLTALDVAAVHDGLHKAAVEAHGRAGETRSRGALMADIAVDVLLAGLVEGNLGQEPTGPTNHDPAGTAPESGTIAHPNCPAERTGNPAVPGRAPVKAEVMVVIPAGTATGQTDEPAELAGSAPSTPRRRGTSSSALSPGRGCSSTR